MARFLRNIRQKFLIENRLTRYLVYAIGEIFLVVIGILIALQFNNRNSERKINQENARLVSDLEKGLETNQFLLERFTGRLYTQDSLMGLLISGQITEENFRRNRLLNDIMANTTQFAWLRDENILTILQKERDFDLSYSQLLKLIKNYKSRLDELDNSMEELNELANWNERIMAENFEWYSGTNREDQNKRTLYYLNDPFYKNRLSLYRKKFSGQISHMTSLGAIRAGMMAEIRKFNNELSLEEMDPFFQSMGLKPFPKIDCSEINRAWERSFPGLHFFLFFNSKPETVTVYRLRDNADQWEEYLINAGEFEIFAQIPGMGFMIGSPQSCEELYIAEKGGYLIIK
jgi:hypothetical protein